MNNNLFLAIFLSVGIWVGFQYFYIKPQQEAIHAQYLARQVEGGTTTQTAAVPPPSALRDRGDVLKDSPRLPLETPELKGSLNLKGARLDDLLLTKIKETVAPDSPPIALLSPSGSAKPLSAYYAELSWLAEKPDVAVPNAETLWHTRDTKLSPDHPVTLTWDNGYGLIFTRMIAVDSEAMFTFTDRVVNKGAGDLTLYPFGTVARQGIPINPSGSTVVHEGALGVLDGTLTEIKYKKLMDAGKKAQESKGGWLGITDKYWLVAMIPPQDDNLTASFTYHTAKDASPEDGYFQTDFRGAPITVAAGGQIERIVHLFAGVKTVDRLDTYADRYDIPHFDRAIDFGWFYFLTRPFLFLLTLLTGFSGSVGMAILLFTILLKLATLPLSQKSYHSMARMKALQPEIQRIQTRFPDDKMRQGQETMELYKREKVSPMSGCVPMVIQIPIFFALYKVLYVSIEMRQAPFYGWIRDMSLPDPTNLFNAFGALHFDPPTMLHVGIWPLLMGGIMFLQQKLSPQPTDKSQARIFLLMPVFFTWMLASMPAGLVIYWTWSNLLGIAQQWYIMRKDLRKKGA